MWKCQGHNGMLSLGKLIMTDTLAKGQNYAADWIPHSQIHLFYDCALKARQQGGSSNYLVSLISAHVQC